ncbi:DNA excision repair protein ERCC-5-like [Mytilus galloprovincialis]|uniref:DNA excision repair protein ERCC-5-like n=1 Tax=Mytilus galloprovincialis TaxID=29158 RepID=UPI003F7B3C73
MGVQGLWQLLNPTGRPVSLQSLEGKILAVDVSIWLHQAVKGMRDRDGNPLPNAHLQVLFNRLCKLLYYRIKPVFVFDGGVPVLKKQTMAGRREKKEFAELESDKATKNLVQNLMKSHAINAVLKKDDSSKHSSSGPKPSTSNQGKPDMFELPPLPEEFKSISEESRRAEFSAQERLLLDEVDLDQIDIESDVFNSLPSEMKHEVLTLLKEKKKRHTWNQILELPQESNDFSNFQMAKLMKQNKLSSRLADVTKEMNDNRSGDLTRFLGDDFYSDAIETRKIMSDDTAHSILIKGLGSKEQKEEMERIRLELEEKKKEENSDEKIKDKLEENKLNISDKIDEIIEIEERQHDLNKICNNHKADEVIQGNKTAVKKDSPSKINCPTDVNTERQDILKELHQRMNVLKDKSSDEDSMPLYDTNSVERNDHKNHLHIGGGQTVNLVDESVKVIDDVEVTAKSEGVLKNVNVENSICETPAIVSDQEIVQSKIKDSSLSENNKSNNSSDETVVKTDNMSIVSTEKAGNMSFVSPEKAGNISFVSPEKTGNISFVSSEKTANMSFVSPEKTEKDLISTRQSILDELRQKMTVLSSDMDITEEDNMEIDNEKKEFEMKQVISENRKCLLKKQLSLEEEQEVKKRKLNQDTPPEDNTESNKPPSENNSESDSEDEGFIEVVLDIDKAQPDDLFPADIFQPAQIVEEDLDIVSDEEPVYQQDQKEVDSSPDAQEVNEDLQSVMSEDENSKEIISNYSIDEAEEEKIHGKLVQQFKNFTENDMRDYQENLEAESRDLQQERGKQERLAVSITDQMYTEAQELLDLFGVPYIVSPMEAEAQCAQLDISNLTQGSITDDSDVWLFGGKRVYKNFFQQDKHVEFFSELSIHSQLGIGRDVFIKLALLCGSDYTPGIQGVGPITAMEVLTEFPGESIEGLMEFKKWWDEAQKQITAPLEPKIKTKLRKLEVPEGFPNELVVSAYMKPEVDDSEEKFAWGQPELDLIRLFTKKKFGWSQEKCDENLVPMMKQLNLRQTQTRIHTFFQPEHFIQPKNIKSKRLQRALNIMQGKVTDEPVQSSVSLTKQSVSSPVMPGMQQVKSMARQIMVGKGRGRGKGKGKGKSSVGQKKTKVTIKNEVNLSESSSESSGDDLIASLDYESMIGESIEQSNSKLGSSSQIMIGTNIGNVKNNSKERAKKSVGSNSSSTNNKKSAIETNIMSQSTSVNTAACNSNSTLDTGSQSSSTADQGTSKVRRTKPNITVGKAGHATEDFSLDLPKEPIAMKGFLEDEVHAFDKKNKMKSKTEKNKKEEIKKQRSEKLKPDKTIEVKKNDKGKSLVKKGKSRVKSSKLNREETSKSNVNMFENDKNSKSAVTVNDQDDSVDVPFDLLNRRTRSCRSGTVNRVMVVSDSDSN